MTAVLWHIELSHYSEKARWALDYKGLPYERRTPMPGLHRIRAATLTRGFQARLPVLELDGRRVADSTAIIAALEDARPEPALYPADVAERARALALEDDFDERLGPAVRRFVWFHTLPDADATAAALFTEPHPARERMLRATMPLARRAVSADYGASAAGAQAARATILETLGRIEQLTADSGYLVGDAFTVADLTGAALMTPLIAPPERPYAPSTVAPDIAAFRQELLERPGGAWVTDVYARHRGVPVAA